MVGRVHARWRAVPLSGRLVAIIAALLLLGLAAISAATLTALRVQLVSQVDEELTGSARGIAQRVLDQITRGDGEDQFLPSNFFVRIEMADGTERTIINDDVEASLGVPRTPAADLDALRDAAEPLEPVTLAGRGTTVPWRAVVLPVSGPDGQVVGAATVALPLAAEEKTLARTAQLVAMAGLGIAAFGAVAAWLAVRRSLRPLREIEATAGAIAAGDLSRRVPAAPPSTEVGSLALSLNAMLAQIEQSFAARAASERRMRRFVSDASHELRTPLSTIRGYGELYRMGGVEDVDQAMGRIETEAKRMGNLVEDLLQLARLDEGRPLVLSQVDLAAVARDAVADLGALAPDRPAAVVPLDQDDAAAGTGDVGAVPVTADADRVRQVVANLVGNVVQHTPAGTPVEIAVGVPEPGWALLEVRDHGPGIAEEDAPRVFERFYRVDPSRTRSSGGSGLGLAIVAAVVGAHAGGVRVLPTPGGGTTVQVALPVEGPVPAGADRTEGAPADRTDGGLLRATDASVTE
jgi:two-component system OmpR family sensor kinase